MSTEPPRFDATPSVSNHFAWIRTQLGLQRTLMAATRTSVSLIGFGFTVAQFFQRMQGVEGMSKFGVDLPRNLGLVLIAAGVVSLFVFTWQYHIASAYLRAPDFQAIAGISKRHMHSASYFVAIVVMLIGIAAFGSVFLHF
jgi:putative membrane protein